MAIVVPVGERRVELLRFDDLPALGISRWTLRAALERGAWTRVRRGYFVRAAPNALDPTSWHIVRTYAALDAGEGRLAASHWSACAAFGLPLYRVLPQPVALTRNEAHSRVDRHATHLVHRTRLRESEIVSHNGIPVTLPCRTLVDMSRTCDYSSSVVAVDAALNRHLVSRTELDAALDDARGRAGIQSARRVVDFARAESESPLESLTRIEFDAHGVPVPTLQFRIRNDVGRVVARADFCWEAEKLVGEADGQSKYLGADGVPSTRSFVEEKRREDAIRDCGFDIIRWGFADLKRPDLLTQRIKRRLAMRKR